MTWTELCDDPRYEFLQDIPFKVELNRFGNIEMSPTRNDHAILQPEIIRRLGRLMRGGKVLGEIAVQTADNTKVADVAWTSLERWRFHRGKAFYDPAPEICVEVVSPTNRPGRMRRKRHLYLSAGAGEFWFCDTRGALKFFNAGGELPASLLCPKFPNSLAKAL